MRHLDDPMTPNIRPISKVLLAMGASGQIQGHHPSRERMHILVNRLGFVFIGWCFGVMTWAGIAVLIRLVAR